MIGSADHLQTLLNQYRALPSADAIPERMGLLITAIAQLAPWRITVWNERGDACAIDSTDTPEEVLEAKAWADMCGVMGDLQAAGAVIDEMERRPVH